MLVFVAAVSSVGLRRKIAFASDDQSESRQDDRCGWLHNANRRFSHNGLFSFKGSEPSSFSKTAIRKDEPEVSKRKFQNVAGGPSSEKPFLWDRQRVEEL
jgi:hypothetical protein